MQKVNVNFDDPCKLKPIDVKDIEKPDKYDNHIAKFTIWYEWFRDLLENRHPNCEHVFNAIEKAGKTRVASVEDLLNLVDSGDTKIKQIIKDQSQMYMCQLKPACGRTMEESCTHELLRQDVNGIMDLLRDIVYKGKNRNPNRLVELKPKALTQPRAAKTADVDRVLTERNSVRRQILDEDPSYKLDDENPSDTAHENYSERLREIHERAGILTNTTDSNKHCSTRSAQGKWTMSLERETLVLMHLVIYHIASRTRKRVSTSLSK